MTLEELDKLGGELFKAIDKASKGDDPRFKEEGQIVRTAIMLAVEFVADHKRMMMQGKEIIKHLEFLNEGLGAMIDLQAAGYKDGILVKIANEIQIETDGLNEQIKGAAKEAFNPEGPEGPEGASKEEQSDYYTQEATEAIKEFDKEATEINDSPGHRNNRAD